MSEDGLMEPSSRTEPQESRFVDPARRELVDRLLEAFDEVSESGVPQWISLTAESGWGKSRLLREMYRVLAAERQADGAFWPDSLVAGLDQGGPSGGGLRKRVMVPDGFVSEKASTPSWVWWGIGCDQRYGTPMDSLTHDAGQISRLEQPLEALWKKRAGIRKRVARELSERREDLTGEAFGQVAETVIGALGLTVPGLGLVVSVAKWAGRMAVSSALSWDDSAPDIVDDLAVGVGRIAADVVPIIVVVEDFHMADDRLVEFLGRIMNAESSSLLLITTSWPGMLDDTDRPCSNLLDLVSQDRVRSWSQDGDQPALRPFAEDARRLVVDGLLPATMTGDVRTAVSDILIDRYSTPMTLELAAASVELRRAVAAGLDPVEAALGLPRSVSDLFRIEWESLPAPVRLLGMLCAASSPLSVSAIAGVEDLMLGDVRWDQSAVEKVVDAIDWVSEELGGPASEFADVPEVHGWVRRYDDWLRQFHEPARRQLVLAEARNQLGDGYLNSYLEYLANGLTVTGEGSEERSGDRVLHRARLIHTLHEAGIPVDDDQWKEAALVVARHLVDQPGSEVVLAGDALARRVLGSDDLSGTTRRAALSVRLHAMIWLGQLDDAISAGTALLDEQVRVLGSDHVSTLATRSDLVSVMAGVGHFDESLELAEGLLADQVRRFGTESRRTYATRHNIGFSMIMLGRVSEGLETLRTLLEDQLRIYGADDVDVLMTRTTIAVATGLSGNEVEAFLQLEQLLADQNRIVGTEHRQTLVIRKYHAMWADGSGDVGRPASLFQRLLADEDRILGPDHPETIVTRMLYAAALIEAGDHASAGPLLDDLLNNAVGAMPAKSALWLQSRSVIASALAEIGQVELALSMSREVVDDSTEVFGRLHPFTLDARTGMVMGMAQHHYSPEITSLAEELLEDSVTVYGTDHENTEMVSEFSATMLIEVAENEGPERALELGDDLLSSYTLLLGPMHRGTLFLRGVIVQLVAGMERFDKAISLAAELLEDQVMILGPTDKDVLTTRFEEGVLVVNSGDEMGGVKRFVKLLLDQVVVLGTDNEFSLQTRSLIVTLCTKALDPCEGSRTVGQLLRELEPRLSENHEFLKPIADANSMLIQRCADRLD